jgi:hypothetical protein
MIVNVSDLRTNDEHYIVGPYNAALEVPSECFPEASPCAVSGYGATDLPAHNDSEPVATKMIFMRREQEERPS